MNSDRKPHCKHIAALGCLALLVAGCGHHSHHSTPLVAEGLVGEVEPNDSAFDANYLGHLYAGSSVRVLGRISAADLYDGFAFVAGEPLSVRFVLSATNPTADLDVCVYDPSIDDFVLCFEDPLDPEVGSFDVLDAGTEFHLVVTPFEGVSDYELEIVATCCSLSSVALEAGTDDDEVFNHVGGHEVESTSALSVAPQAALSQRETARLRAYTKSGEVVADEDVEPQRARGVLIEMDDHGAIDAAAFDVSSEGELRVRGRR